jgi:hypothetical protein
VYNWVSVEEGVALLTLDLHWLAGGEWDSDRDEEDERSDNASEKRRLWW